MGLQLQQMVNSGRKAFTALIGSHEGGQMLDPIHERLDIGHAAAVGEVCKHGLIIGGIPKPQNLIPDFRFL